MNLRNRIRYLERAATAAGCCPACRDRAGYGLRRYRRDSPRAAAVLVDTSGDTAGPCPACGWRPDVREVVEIVVRNRGEAELLLKRNTDA